MFSSIQRAGFEIEKVDCDISQGFNSREGQVGYKVTGSIAIVTNTIIMTIMYYLKHGMTWHNARKMVGHNTML